MLMVKWDSTHKQLEQYSEKHLPVSQFSHIAWHLLPNIYLASY